MRILAGSEELERSARAALRARGCEGPNVRLTIEDDGRGLGPDAGPNLGWLGMQERVALVEGKVEIDSRPGGGTEIRARSVWNTSSCSSPWSTIEAVICASTGNTSASAAAYAARAGMNQWATQAEARVSAELKDQDATVRSRKKKR